MAGTNQNKRKKKKHLGSFDTQKDAAKAYNVACDIYFGDYANKNIISDDE